MIPGVNCISRRADAAHPFRANHPLVPCRSFTYPSLPFLFLGAVHILYNALQGEEGWQIVICVIWGEGYALLTLYNAARLRHTFYHFYDTVYTILHGSDCRLIVGVHFVQWTPPTNGKNCYNWRMCSICLTFPFAMILFLCSACCGYRPNCIIYAPTILNV